MPVEYSIENRNILCSRHRRRVLVLSGGLILMTPRGVTVLTFQRNVSLIKLARYQDQMTLLLSENDSTQKKQKKSLHLLVVTLHLQFACIAGGIRGHKGGSLKYRLPKN